MHLAMHLATFLVSILDTDPDTGQTDVSYVEVGTTEISEDDILKALHVARSQREQIVAGLKPSFPGLSTKDVQIHIRPSSIQLMLDPTWKRILRDEVYYLFVDDPKAPTLATMNMTTKPKDGVPATGAKESKPVIAEGPTIAAMNLDTPEHRQELIESLAVQSSDDEEHPSYGEWLAAKLDSMSQAELSRELHRTTSRYNEYLETYPND